MSGFYRSRRACITVTGASRGFGASLAIAFAQHYRHQFASTKEADDQLMFILVARNHDDLLEVGNQLRSVDCRIDFLAIVGNLSGTEAITTVSDGMHQHLANHRYEHFVLLHNAGSVGDPSQLCRDISVEQRATRDVYYRLNLYSVMELTGVFIRLTEYASHKHIVNVSSLAAVKPFKGLTDYCVGKAAREAFFRSLVHELQDKVRVLNYAPGPLDTDMFHYLQTEGILVDEFRKMVPLTPLESAEKLLKLLTLDQYSSGDHIDFYDDC